MKTVVLLGLAVVSCRPHLPYVETDAIDRVGDLERLMNVQADTADPGFDLASDLADDPAAATDAQLGRLIEMGVRLTRTARRIEAFSMGARFDELARNLGTRAADLERAARSGDKPATVQAVFAIRDACRTCHKEFR